MNSNLIQIAAKETNKVVPEAPKEKQLLKSGASFSWWCYPASVYKNGANYFTLALEDGRLTLNKLYKGVLKSVVVNYIEVDEHNRPSFLPFDDFILVFSHPRNGINYFCRKVNYDMTLRGPQINLGIQSGLTESNYSQPFYVNGRLFVTCRESKNFWAITWSDDMGQTWAQNKRWIHWTNSGSNDKMYTLSNKHNDKMVIGAYFHPVDSGAGNKFFLLEFDPITGEYTEAGVSKGNLYDDNFTTIESDDLTSLYSLEAGRNFRFYDLSLSDNGTVINVFISNFADDYSNGVYILKRYNRNTLEELESIEIVASGYDTYKTYFGGIYFRKNDNSIWNGDFYLSRNENNIWYIEEWEYSNGSVSKVKELESLEATAEELSLNRPEPPINSDKGGMSVMYQRGDFNELFTDLDEVEIIAMV